ncbi:hypothetical protein MAR_021118, partial [Mya arenaria]
ANPVFETQAASPYEHLTTGEQTEYTEIGLAVPTTKPLLMSVFTPEKMPLIQSWSQQTDSHTASSNYEVPDNHNGLNIEFQAVDENSDSTSSTLLIAGAVGGTFVAVVTCLVVLIWLKRKYNGGCNCRQNAVELRQSAKNKGDNDITEPDNQAYDQYENLSDAGRSHYSHLDAAQLASHASKCNDLTMYMDK